MCRGCICRNLFDQQQNITAIGATVCDGLGISFVAQDTVYFGQIATHIWKTEVGAFLGRTAILLGCTRALSAVEELPSTMYFSIFQVYSLAFTATPNIFELFIVISAIFCPRNGRSIYSLIMASYGVQ